MSRATPPEQVPAYAAARTGGLVPAPGRVPPEPLDGVSAGTMAVRWTVGAIVVFFGFIAVALVAGRSLPDGGAIAAVIAGAGVLVLAGTWIAWGRVGRRAVREYQAGYATLVLTEGAFWMGSLRPWLNAATRIRWDFGATWVLDRRTAAVVAAPGEEGSAPGFYPSPDRPDRWELWTGRMWAGIVRRPEWVEALREGR